MIIKKVIIENFLCYYNEKEFVFADGLNIILGENGEGKTKFYDALEWLLKGNTRNLKSLISARKLYELEEDASFKVKVAIQVEQRGTIKQITRYFNVERKEGEISAYNYSIEGIEENIKGEREPVDGERLLETIFPQKFRKYSMFKGESELDIFNETKSLKNLIDTFSFARHYEKYTKTLGELEIYAEKAIEKDSRRSKSQENIYKKLKFSIGNNERKLRDLKTRLNFSITNKDKSDTGLNNIENNVKNAEYLKLINGRIEEIEDKIRKAENKIDENYTNALLDENWILIHFESIFNEFSEKITQISKTKRKLQKEHHIEIGRKQQQVETTTQLLKEFTPLPIDTPSRELMEEMLHEEHCKVCNRPAPKDTEAYNFMQKRLEEFLKAQLPKKEEEAPLYSWNYLKRVQGIQQNQETNLYKIKNINKEIQDRIEFNNGRKKQIKRLRDELERENENKIKILSVSNSSEIDLLDNFRNFREWQRTSRDESASIEKYKVEIEELEIIIQGEKNKLDTINKESSANFLIKTQAIIRDIAKIFQQTEKRKFNEFLALLEEKTNRIFSKINVDAFTGVVRFRLNTDNSEVKILLEEADGRIFSSPNQSLETSRHLSILFAISELTKESKDENYPLIFDASTSSFGESKTAQFFNLLNDTPGQKILLIKDFIIKNEANQLVIKDEFKTIKRDKALWVKLERPFDPVQLHTINSQVINLS